MRTTSTTWTAPFALTAEEIKGRNMWIVWTGGDDKFWDTLTVHERRHSRSPEDDFFRILD